MVLVMDVAQVINTSDGPISDPKNPGRRLKFKNGMYQTNDPDEIAFLQKHCDFEKQGPDGFHVQRSLSAEEELAAVAKRHGMTKDELLTTVKE